MTIGTVTTVLLTGFEPFGGQTINPSWAAVQEVRRTWAGWGEDIHVLELPVHFVSVDRLLTDALEPLRPDVVICVAQAGGPAQFGWSVLPSTSTMPGSPKIGGGSLS